MPETNLTEDEIRNFSHPIWLPVYFQYSQKYKAGNTFIVLIGGREYPFEIAGFYESGLMGNANSGLKCVISEADYQLLSVVMDEKKVNLYDVAKSIAYDCFDFDSCGLHLLSEKINCKVIVGNNQYEFSVTKKNGTPISLSPFI